MTKAISLIKSHYWTDSFIKRIHSLNDIFYKIYAADNNKKPQILKPLLVIY